MDGVLLDSAFPAFDLIRNTLQSKGVEVSLASLLNDYNGKHSNDIYEDLIGRYDFRQTVDEFRSEHKAINGNFYSDAYLAPMEGLAPFLEYLKSNGTSMAVVSSTSSRNVLAALNRMSLVRYFSTIVCGDHVDWHKPAPDGYLMAVALLTSELEHCLVVEDSKPGILAGKNAGITVVGYKGSVYRQDTSDADVEVFSFDELSEWIKSAGLMYSFNTG